MEYSKNFIVNINNALKVINDIVYEAEKAGGENGMLYLYRDELIELSLKIENKENLDLDFMKKWKPLIGSAHRIFEDHPLLDLLYDINNTIKSLQNPSWSER
jgi:hypothetical protein